MEAFCIYCGCKRPYFEETLKGEFKHKGKEYFYKHTEAVCMECGSDVYVPEINDRNVAERNAAIKDSFYYEVKLYEDCY